MLKMSQSPESYFWKLVNENESLPMPSSSQNNKKGTTAGCTSLGLVQKSETSTRVSLLVEALIKSMVAAYETDSRKSARAYRRICRRLFRMGLIDGSWSMAELEGARAQFEHGLLQLLGVRPARPPSLPSLWPGGDSASQYKREFDEIRKIGRGAFGKVFRVRNKLDGAEYAVKKVPIHSEGLNSLKTYLSEVKMLASMNHPNIVQYKAAWLEIGPQHDFNYLTEPPLPHWNKQKITIPSKESVPFILNKSISFMSHKNHKSETNFEIAFEGSNNSVVKSNTNSFKEGAKNSKAEKGVVLQEEISLGSQEVCWATLYIQMSLCHGTLHHWLRRRNKSFNPDNALTSHSAQAFKFKAIREILIQILKGLAYIHSRGVVHHDIKPSNIFVSADGGSLLVQLGDFGLACPLQRARHCLARGTPLYAAPEQLAGHCDPKSDMYSVGIVLFELLEDFNTDMERTRRISELRGRLEQPVPKELDLNNLVTALVRRLPEERPDALTLLNSLESTADSSSSQVEALQARLNEKDREIQRLTELLRQHGVQEI